MLPKLDIQFQYGWRVQEQEEEHADNDTTVYFLFFGNRQTGSCPPLLRQDTAQATRTVRP